jgi:hypothetical protein
MENIQTKTIETIISDFLFDKRVKVWKGENYIALQPLGTTTEHEGIIKGVRYNPANKSDRPRINIEILIDHKVYSTKVYITENIIFISK